MIRMKPLSCDKRVNPSGRTRAVLLSALCAIASSILLTSCSSATLRTDGIAGTLAAGTVSSDLPAVVYTAPEGEEAWYDRSAIVAHALGSVDGRCESNSKEALVQTYSRGQRVFEVDLTLTADNFLVARHDFADDSYYTLEQQKPENPVMDLSTFISTPIMGIYTPVTVDDIANFMAEHGDVWLVTDTKSTDESTIRAQFERLCRAFDSNELLDRVIVQIYNTAMYEIVREVYPFKNYIFTVYQLAERDYNAIGKFCAENGIAVVTMPSSTADSSVTALLHSYGLHVYVHTVNRITTMGTMIKYGLCDGFYSDYVTEPELASYIKENGDS